VTDLTERNLLAAEPGPPPTLLPNDPAVAELAKSGRDRFLEIVRANPASSLCWALLAEGSLRMGTPEGDIGAYAYARTGYHRGLDALRRAGWKGGGPIPWEHVPNRGFLRSLYALALAAERIGDTAEYERCTQFLRDSSSAAYEELTAQSQVLGKSPNDRPEEVR
jgi:Protein of unknown function (DUF3151)